MVRVQFVYKYEPILSVLGNKGKSRAGGELVPQRSFGKSVDKTPCASAHEAWTALSRELERD